MLSTYDDAAGLRSFVAGQSPGVATAGSANCRSSVAAEPASGRRGWCRYRLQFSGNWGWWGPRSASAMSWVNPVFAVAGEMCSNFASRYAVPGAVSRSLWPGDGGDFGRPKDLATSPGDVACGGCLQATQGGDERTRGGAEVGGDRDESGVGRIEVSCLLGECRESGQARSGVGRRDVKDCGEFGGRVRSCEQVGPGRRGADGLRADVLRGVRPDAKLPAWALI